VVTTKSALHFFQPASLSGLITTVHVDEDEWAWKSRGDPVLHIELRKWADVMVIAPLSANTLAKISNGLCDNLLTCIVRAWDFHRPLLLAPAMNTLMWEHPFTSKQLDIMKSLGAQIIDPVSKLLMCNDKGNGALADVNTIVERVREAAVGGVRLGLGVT